MREFNNKNLISRILKDTIIIYAVSFVMILAFTFYFSYTNGEAIIDNIMINFRSYLLGSINTGENIFSAMFDTIGIFIIHFTIIFTMIFLHYFVISDEALCDKLLQSNDKETLNMNKGTDKMNISKIFIIVLLLIISICCTVFLRENFLFSLPLSLAIASCIYILLLIVKDKKIISAIVSKSNNIIFISRIIVIIISLIGIMRFVAMMMPESEF